MAIEQERLARGLGWFSIGLGVAEVLAPGRVAALIGVEDQEDARTMLRGFGVREIGTGVGLLTMQQPGGWMWARVAGDLLDLSALGSAFASPSTDRRRLAAATAAVAGVTALDLAYSMQLTRNGAEHDGGVMVRKAITINRPLDEVRQRWRERKHTPQFLGEPTQWTETDDSTVWESRHGDEVECRGMVQFQAAPADRGTEVLVAFEYQPTAGRAGAAVAKLFGADPGQQAYEDLRKFKQIVEIGEVVVSDAERSNA